MSIAARRRQVNRRKEALRRYPAIGFIFVAGALALILPSALLVPIADPTTLAEYAPVPGSARGESDLSNLEGGSSGDLGFGSGARQGGDQLTESTLGRPGQRRGRLKKCVGNPPRQSEDPLSPPCVAFFQGDNGGATYKGVTADEIKVVLFNNWLSDALTGYNGDLNDPIQSSDPSAVRTAKAYVRYFNERFQTYGRSVHVVALASTGGSEARRRADAATTLEMKPFLVSGFTQHNAASAYAGGIASGKIVIMVGIVNNLKWDSSFLRANAPYVYSLSPDIESDAHSTAGAICRMFAGRKAERAGDPLLRDRIRKFGITFDLEYGRLLMEALKAEAAAQCNLTFTVKWIEQGETTEGPTTTQAMASFRQENVTTVIPLTAADPTLLATNVATSSGYFPEWLVDGSYQYDASSTARLFNSAQWRNAFGVTWRWRSPGPTKDFWYAAYKEVDTVGEPNFSYGYWLYYSMLQLFTVIQGAGPRPNPDSVQRALRTFSYSSTSPFIPSGGYGLGGYSFVNDAMVEWWDPAGTPPEGQPGSGCYRLPGEGNRYKAAQWPSDPNFPFSDGPCDADPRRIADQ